MSGVIFKRYPVLLERASYEILLGRDIISGLGDFLAKKTKDRKVLIVIDEFFRGMILGSLLDELNEASFSTQIYNFAAGKQNKNINEAMRIYEVLESNDFARDSTIISIGGGVIGDLAGFVASTYLRGMNLIHIPTTLTAMIDSSIGGKVAINFRKTVNAIGNYYHPILNVIDLCFLETLSDRDFKAGLAEAIKCAIICDEKLFDFMNTDSSAILSRNEDALLEICCRAIEIKLDHVTGDVREQGKRLKLNYGHTLGHAIETSTGVFEEVYRHGEGVSLGMVGAAYIAREHINFNGKILSKHKEILKKYNLPIKVESSKVGFEKSKLLNECMKIIWKDKKKMGNKLRFILPLEIGRCEIYDNISDELIKRAYDFLIVE